MEPLLSAAAELVTLLPPARIGAIADRVRDCAPGEDIRGLHQLVTTPVARAALDRFLNVWDQHATSNDLLAGILLGAAYAHQKTLHESSVELVWTGPTTSFVATRRTEQVLLDLIRRAERDLFLVSFVAYDVPSVIDEMKAAVARGVEIRILLETDISHGGSLTVDPVATMRSRVPEALIYVWTDRYDPFSEGRVHAKVAVADGYIAFVTSANLTGHALEKNMEAGVVISGGLLPERLHSHLNSLIQTKIIRRA